MSTITLSKGFAVMVDESDLELLSKLKWHYSAGYARTKSLHRGLKGVFMHNLIMQPQPGFEVDHIDGDSLNNKRSNLRICTRAENMRNVKRPRSNKSGYKGVSWYPKYNKWRASINSRFLGYFDDPKQASRAYDDAAKAAWGEYARTNG